MIPIKSHEITPEHIYRSRRKFMVGVGALAASAALSACGATKPNAPAAEAATATNTPAGQAPTATSGVAAEGSSTAATNTPAATATPSQPYASVAVDELGDALTDYEAVVNYNNFYEFTTDKEDVAKLSANFQTDPWRVEISGLVNNPMTLSVDDIIKRYTQEERVYRLRCVEAWSMVIPWLGFSLGDLLKDADPTSAAKYVRFESINDPKNLPGQKSSWYQWPYVEGLRMDEAMNPLATVATGLYGQSLLPQSGAPIRLVVPWKYGFKSIKSIVKIELVDYEPKSLWMAAAPNEYGFYANVNPNVNHPRWSQATERRIGELGRRATWMFNGYEEEVAHLYEGMDLTKWF